LRKYAVATFFFVAVALWYSAKTVLAISSIVTFKEVPLTIIVVAPSPVAFMHLPPSPGQSSSLQVASISSYDTPMGILPPTIIAQSAGQQGAVPVKFLTKPDPTSTYLHEIPINTTITAQQGTTTYVTCPYEMYAYYTTPYNVTDWGYGTTSTGTTGAFPILNYPQASDLAFVVTAVGVPPAANATYTNFSNSGSPGQSTFTGTAGEKQTQCINLKLTVPKTQAVGTYEALIQYNLYST